MIIYLSGRAHNDPVASFFLGSEHGIVGKIYKVVIILYLFMGAAGDADADCNIDLLPDCVKLMFLYRNSDPLGFGNRSFYLKSGAEAV